MTNQSMTERATVVVAGGLGVFGRTLVETLVAKDQWNVIALSRRQPNFETSVDYRAVDLADRDACEAVLGTVKDASHLFYTANYRHPDRSVEAATNLAMLVNTIDVLERSAPNLRHVNLIHGTKAYGSRLGPYKTPAVETDPRLMPPMWYYDQEDWIRQCQHGKHWTWSTLRPPAICGYANGAGANVITILGVYGSLCKALNIPLWFPGTHAGFHALRQASDARLLARQAIWAASTPACANEVFNVNNGSYYRWENIWPRVAKFFGVEPAGPLNIRLAEFMADKAPVWDKLVQAHDLRAGRFDEIVQWHYGESFHEGWDSVSNTNKFRKTGFNEVIDDDQAYLDLLEKMRTERFIP